MTKYFIIILLLSGIFIGAVFLPKSLGSEDRIIFQVEKGEGSRDIAYNLEKQGLIWWAPLFRTYVFLGDTAGKLQAGCYFLSSGMTTPQIVKTLTLGAIAKERVTIPEGFTSEQIHQIIRGLTTSDRQKLKEYEGYLFPDTYEIPYCMEQEKIIKIMLDNFNQKTASLKITPEIVVMASILEKELKTKEDKELASGILWKRLKAGMPLQTDAYPWTYENLGLPEKAICNPGLESILAALHPKESQFWYYLSTPEGTTIFSRTLEGHNTAKAIYLK